MAITLNPIQQMHQEDHNARHPGKICRTCPVEVAHRHWLEQQAERAWQRREAWVTVAALAFALGMAYLLLALLA